MAKPVPADNLGLELWHSEDPLKMSEDRSVDFEEEQPQAAAPLTQIQE